jgi:hypothetical protein
MAVDANYDIALEFGLLADLHPAIDNHCHIISWRVFLPEMLPRRNLAALEVGGDIIQLGFVEEVEKFKFLFETAAKTFFANSVTDNFFRLGRVNTGH